MKIEIRKGARAPGEGWLGESVRPAGWWVSDETMRLVVKVMEDRYGMCDIDSPSCDGCVEHPKECYYGEEVGELCAFSAGLIKAFKEADDGKEGR